MQTLLLLLSAVACSVASDQGDSLAGAGWTSTLTSEDLTALWAAQQAEPQQQEGRWWKQRHLLQADVELTGSDKVQAQADGLGKVGAYAAVDSSGRVQTYAEDRAWAQQYSGLMSSFGLNATRAVSWRGRVDKKYKLSYFAPYVVQSGTPESLRSYVTDPTAIAGSPQTVLRVRYPAGTWSPGSGKPGGTLFYAFPFGNGGKLSYIGATLEYDVYFPPDFDWVKGGKLPGLAGGPTGCGGGADAVSMHCWSVRVMWRRNGDGEAYIYVPEQTTDEGGYQLPEFCDQPPYTKCDWHAGVSFMRGAFKFRPGSWHRISLTVRLNDAGKHNGLVEVKLNGKQVIYWDKLLYRLQDSIFVDSVYFGTWFGGSDVTWAPSKDTYVLFKNIRVHRMDPPSGRGAAALSASGPQVVLYANITEPP